MMMEWRAALISNVVAPQPVITLFRIVFVGISSITSESHDPLSIFISLIIILILVSTSTYLGFRLSPTTSSAAQSDVIAMAKFILFIY